MLSLLVLSLLSFAAARGRAPAPCYASFDNKSLLETPCYDVLLSDGEGFEVRNYSSGSDVTLVSYDISNSTGIDPKLADYYGAYYVICYFMGGCNTKNESLLTSRTVPLVLRPPSATRDNYIEHMALAPSSWPVSRKPPTPTNNVTLDVLGDVLLASLHIQASVMPQPSDYDATCADLVEHVQKNGNYAIDEASPFTFSHARYFGWVPEGELFDYECWAAVAPL